MTSLRMAFALGALLAAASSVTATPARDTDYKIDRELMAKLTDDAGAVVPFFVVFAERAPVKQAFRIPDLAARRAFVVQSLEAVADRSQTAVRAILQARGVRFTPYWIENEIYIPEGTLALARDLAERPEVVALVPEVNYPLPPIQLAPDIGIQAIPWNVSQIRADQAWATAKGSGITVANIDTGVQYNHPALAQQYRGNTGGNFTHTGNWKDTTGLCGNAPCDNHGHGTHTMGTMVGDDGSANQVGVAPQARWIACKGCTDSSCPSSNLRSCAQWIMSPDGGAPPDIVNNSWGGGRGDSWYQNYVANWVAAGIFPAFSAGNEGPSCGSTTSPGEYPESFASGAIDSAGAIAGFSSRGPSAFGGIIKPDVSAPGVAVRSSWPTNTYATVSGTSMASPHTAGTVALLWAARPEYKGNIGGSKSRIRETAAAISTVETCGGLPVGAVPNNTFGSGRIDALAAVQGGLPVNQPPTVQITGPPNGATFSCPATVTFSATASDPDGTAGAIQWTENNVAFGTGDTASKTYDCNAAGSHSITAAVADDRGASDTDTIGITIVNSAIPAAPTNLAASVSGAIVTLLWTDQSANEDGFRIERKKAKGGGWRVVGTTGPNVPAYSDSPGKGSFQYRVSAYNQAGSSAPSNIATGTVR